MFVEVEVDCAMVDIGNSVDGTKELASVGRCAVLPEEAQEHHYEGLAVGLAEPAHAAEVEDEFQRCLQVFRCVLEPEQPRSSYCLFP